MHHRIGQIIQSTRAIISDLKPGILDDKGLKAAMEWLIEDFEKNSGLFCEFEIVPDDLQADSSLSITLFRILQESLNNILKHAQADRVRIKLIKTEDCITLGIADNGVGFQPTAVDRSQSHGLSGMRERAQAFAGNFRVKSLRNVGTAIKVTLPL